MSLNPQTGQLRAGVRFQPGVSIIDLMGEINGFAEEALNAAYQQAERDEPRVILLNFTKVDYINSTGIALIVSLLAQARKSQRHLMTYGLSDHYVEIFKVTRLSDFMGIYPDEETALGNVKIS